LNKYKNAASGG